MTNTGNPHGLEIVVEQCHQSLADNFVFWNSRVRICRFGNGQKAGSAALRTYEAVRVLVQAYGGNEVGAFLHSPLGDDGLG